VPATDFISLLGQVPLVGVFIFFTLTLLRRQAESEERRDREWRDFLREQREQSSLAIGRIADEVKLLAQQTAAMNALLVTHDARAEDAIRKLVP